MKKILLIACAVLVIVGCGENSGGTLEEQTHAVNHSTESDWVGCAITAQEVSSTVTNFMEGKSYDPEKLYCAYKRFSIGNKRLETNQYFDYLEENGDVDNRLEAALVKNPLNLGAMEALRTKLYLKRDTLEAKATGVRIIRLMKAMFNTERGTTMDNPLVIVHIDDVKLLIEKRYNAKVDAQTRIFNSNGLPCVRLSLKSKKEGEFDLFYSMLPEISSNDIHLMQEH